MSSSSSSVDLQTHTESGWLEMVQYGKDSCHYPLTKQILALNTCGAYPNYPSPSPSSSPTPFVTITTLATRSTHLYNTTLSFYSDSSCTTSITTSSSSYNFGILHCKKYSYYTDFGNYPYLIHTREIPLDPMLDNLDVAIGIYNNQENCQYTNDQDSEYSQGLLEIWYYRFNNGCGNYNGQDFIITGCSDSSIIGWLYESNDFSCTGSVSSWEWSWPDETCSEMGNLGGVFEGYLNFVCSPQQ